ncbi:MAG: hypothetical protein U0R71_12250 [Solirubrobacterales bacterium]
MDHHEKHEKLRAAQRRLRAQRLRAGALRGRVVAISVIVFVLLWGVVFTQMATGNDPVLNASSRTLASSRGAGRRAAKDRGPIEELAHAGTEKFRETLGLEGGESESEAGESEGGEEAESLEAEGLEAEAAELEAAEIEALEAEEAEAIQAEEELAPLTTSQS